ncbi:uncharacterized, partial [Tachysurus ichikawai]
ILSPHCKLPCLQDDVSLLHRLRCDLSEDQRKPFNSLITPWVRCVFVTS